MKSPISTNSGIPEATRVEWAQALAAFPGRMAKEADGKGQQGTLVLKTFLAEIKAAGVKMPVEYKVD